MRLVLALVVLLALLPVASAQPTPAPCGPLAASATSPQEAVAPGAQGSVEVAVTNTGQRAVEVVATLNPTPEGWRVVGDAEQTATVDAGGEALFTFTVSPTADARGDYAMSIAVQGTCALPAAGVPCPQNACTTQAQPAGATVRLGQPEGGGLPGLDGFNLPLEYLVAGVVLVGVATAIPLLLRKRGGGFVADCPEPLKMVRPGRGTSFPIEVRNTSGDAITAQFDIGPVPEGWTAFMPLPEVQLAPKEARSLWLMVRSPSEASAGEAVDVEVRLRNPARPDNASSVKVRAEVDPTVADGAVRA